MKHYSYPVMILAGGTGTRLGSLTSTIPKPMVLLHGKPLIWHIMKYYASFGLRKFIICLGYKGDVIRNFFLNYRFLGQDIHLNTNGSGATALSNNVEDWDVTLVETGQNCMTGGRVARAMKYVDADRFFLTYGDGLSNVDLKKLMHTHEQEGRLATVTGVQPKSRFGLLTLDGDRVIGFSEKGASNQQWINGGFFMCEKALETHLVDDSSLVFEEQVLGGLARNNQLSVFKHHGFWHCVDTIKDLHQLESVWPLPKKENIRPKQAQRVT